MAGRKTWNRAEEALAGAAVLLGPLALLLYVWLHTRGDWAAVRHYGAYYAILFAPSAIFFLMRAFAPRLASPPSAG